MKKIALILILLSGQVYAGLGLSSHVSSPAVDSLLEEALKLLPEKVKSDLNGTIPVVFKKLDKTVNFEVPCKQTTSKQTYGRAANGKVFLNQNFLPLLDDQTQFDCGHRSWRKQALATLLHEVIHLWEQKQKNKPSSSRHYTYLAHGQRKVIGRNTIRNQNSERSPDAYELSNTAEHFAVNFEYFLLDSTYSCRRPNIAAYFKELFHHDTADCTPNRTIHVANIKGSVPFEFSNTHVKEIHYLLASKGSGISSKFGHTLFRLVTDDPRKDIVVGFVAEVDGLSLSNLGGITGKYPSRLFVGPLQKTIDDYTKVEFRDLYSYKLEINDEQRQALLDQMLTVYWEYSGKYRFFSNNCADEGLFLLKSALPDSPLISRQVLTPYGLRKVLRQSGLISWGEPDHTIHSQWTIQEKIFEKLSPAMPGMDLSQWIKTTAEERKQLYSKASLTRQSIIAAIALEISSAAKTSQELEKKIAAAIFNLPEGHAIKEIAIEYTELIRILSFGQKLEHGYGIPLSTDYSDEKEDVEDIRKRAIAINEQIMAWALHDSPEANEVKASLENQLYLKELMKTL